MSYSKLQTITLQLKGVYNISHDHDQNHMTYISFSDIRIFYQKFLVIPYISLIIASNTLLRFLWFNFIVLGHNIFVDVTNRNSSAIPSYNDIADSKIYQKCWNNLNQSFCVVNTDFALSICSINELCCNWKVKKQLWKSFFVKIIAFGC